MSNESVDVQLAELRQTIAHSHETLLQEVGHIKDDIRELNAALRGNGQVGLIVRTTNMESRLSEVEKSYVSKSAFAPVKLLVYSVAGTAITALVSLCVAAILK